MSELPTPRPYISFETVYAENPVQSGFDLKPTIAWISNNKEMLLYRMNKLVSENASSTHPETIVPGDNSELDPNFIWPLIGLIPEGIRQFSACDQIAGMRTLWFKTVGTENAIETTGNVSEALSPTAIATGGTTDTMNPPSLSVMLCKIPSDIITDGDVRKIIIGITGVHEYLHTITWELLRNPLKKIQVPDGRIVSGASYITDMFASAAARHSPISHYSRGYRNVDSTFQSREGDPNLAIEEELVETLTTLTLGFAGGSLTDITKDPLEDREDVKKICLDFLNAVPAASSTELSSKAA